MTCRIVEKFNAKAHESAGQMTNAARRERQPRSNANR